MIQAVKFECEEALVAEAIGLAQEGFDFVVDAYELDKYIFTNTVTLSASVMELMRYNAPRLTASTYTDTSLLSLQDAVKKPTISPSQIASQISGAERQVPAQSVAENSEVEGHNAIEKKRLSHCLTRRGKSC